jgi:large subunit ribosomal protein L10
VRGGYFDGDVIKGDKILAVADLPSKEQLLSTLLATIQEGPRQVLGVIQGPARDLLYVLNNYASKLEEG